MNPWDAIGALILGWHKAGQLQGWLRLCFGIAFSSTLAFGFAAGTSLFANQGWPVSVGAGLVSASSVALAAYLHANQKLTQGITIAVPQEIVNAQFDKEGKGPTVITSGG